MKYIWFRRKHSKPKHLLGQYVSSPSSSITPKLTNAVKKSQATNVESSIQSPTIPTSDIHNTNPCDKGLKYKCFSIATANHCKYVSSQNRKKQN